jgi:hypothetical protein
VWEGTLTLSGVSADEYHTQLKAYCLARKAAGFEVVVMTTLPWLDDPAEEAKRVASNALIRADWADYADALADVALDGRIGDPGDQNDTTYYIGDAVHLNDAGNAIVAGIVRAAVNGIL